VWWCIISSFLSILFIIMYISNCSCRCFRDTRAEIFELAIFLSIYCTDLFLTSGENILLMNHWILFLRFLRYLISSLLWSCCNLSWEWECPPSAKSTLAWVQHVCRTHHTSTWLMPSLTIQDAPPLISMWF